MARKSEMLPPEKGMAETPDTLADIAVRALRPTKDLTWLDPSAGTGKLVSAALRAGVSADSIVAIDLANDLPDLERLGVTSVLSTDFLEWARVTHHRFDRVIANPPYVRLRDLHEVLLRSALDTRINGVTTSPRANYWVAFLLAGMRLLKKGGSLAYILPAAWEYADYARSVRDLCVGAFQRLEIHRVEKPMFELVSDGCVLLVGRSLWERPRSSPQVFRYSGLGGLSRSFSGSDLCLEKPRSGALRCDQPPLDEDEVRLGDIASVGIGAVTGDASYFLLTESQRISRGLPRSAVRPILSKARHLVNSEISDDEWTQLRDGVGRVWLFSPSEGDLVDPSVKSYIELEAEEGGCRREGFKVRDRDPWYRVRVPDRFDGFVTGMSDRVTWVALNRMSDLTISNTLYGVRFQEIEDIEEQAAWCLSMLSSTTERSRARLARVYPQGLVKLEPGDFARLTVRRPKRVAGARSLYRRTVELLISGQREEAQRRADHWLDT